MSERTQDIVELARLVNELERIADCVEDQETAYRFDEAVRHIEIGVGEWASTSDEMGDILTEVVDQKK